MRKILLAGAAMGALTAGAAQAQVQTQGFFGHIAGFYALESTGTGTTSGNPGGNSNRSVRPGDGWGGDGRVGYRFAGAWDGAIGGGYVNLSPGRKDGGGPVNNFGVDDAWGWWVDGEIGYNITGPGYGVRPFIGVRFARFKHELGYHPDAPVGCCFENTKYWGVGPRVGVDATMLLTDSIGLFGGVDAAALFGKIDGQKGPAFPAGTGRTDTSRVVWNVNARVGLDWELMPLVHLAAGYRVDVWSGVAFTNDGFAAFSPRGRADRVVHGPFVRIAYNWGAPPSGPEAPKPPMAGKKSYIVFFDFDRALITPTAATTIKQAAADAKAGKSTRLDVTGHADKSGGDAYNMALSLRRGNAVKDQLVREGIPAAQIAVVGRGESMPLVQTADGVREPQNRRVEIVIN